MKLTWKAMLVAMAAMLASGTTAQADEQPSPAAQTLARCVQTTGSLSAVVLVDESRSLSSSDPHNRRVEGLRAALAGLDRLASTTVDGKRPRVDVLLVGFSGTVNPDPNARNASPDWQVLTPGGADALISQADEFAARNKGHFTDYKTALLAARQLLAQHAGEQTAAGGDAPCKALIWFTDGRYDIPGGETAIAGGQQFLCRPGGLMDGIVSDRIVKFVVGLSLDPAARGFLRSLTDGSAAACGSQLSPRTGAYYDVRDSAELFFAFGGLLDGNGDRLPPRPVCSGLPCARGATSFALVPGLRSFVIRAVTGAPGITPVLRAPTGQTVTLRPRGPSPSSVAGASLGQQWASDEAVEIEGNLRAAEAAKWSGEWSLTFVDPSGKHVGAVPLARIQLLADAAATVLGQPVIVKGAPTRLRLQLVRADGSPATPSRLTGSAEVAASLTNPDSSAATTLSVRRAPSSFGAFSTSVALASGSPAPFVYVDTATSFAPVGGYAVTTERRSFKLETRLPAGQGYPEVSPTELHPSSIKGKGSTSATLTVHASPDAAGCVWIGRPRTTSTPPVRVAVEPSDIRQPGDCLKLRAGETRKLRLTFSVDRSSSSTAQLQVPVGLRSSLGGGDRQVNLPTSFQLYPPPNIGKRWAIITALTLLGLLLPLGLLWLLNYWGARLSAPQLLRVVSQDVRVSSGAELTALDGSAPISRYIRHEPLSEEGAPRRPRRLSIDAFELNAVAARSVRDLFAGPYAVATAKNQPLLTGTAADVDLKQSDDRTIRRVPLALAGTWLFLPDEVEIPEGDDESNHDVVVTGRLTTVIADGGDIDAGARLIADASARLGTNDWRGEPVKRNPGRLERLKALPERLPTRWSRPDDVEEGAPPPLPPSTEIGEDAHDY